MLDIRTPIIGIGASAGGLEAVSELVGALPATPGMVFLLVQHLDPHHESFLTEILTKKTAIAVSTAIDGAVVKPDHLYVIPPNSALTVADGALRLRPRDSGERPHKPVDVLFQSLAEQYGDRAVAIVLSGTDSDGSQGIEEIKAVGGITMAQEPTSAKFDGMPRSAIATGCVDFVLSPKELANELLRIGRHPYFSQESTDEIDGEEKLLQEVFRLIQSSNGTDFSRYKSNTLRRRLARRMALRRVDGLAEYADLLKNEPAELHDLAQDFLIRVTGFFRDPETFEAITQTVFPALLEDRSPQDSMRIWVPGCSSGEEVYSIAIALLEHLGTRPAAGRIQIFGTDLSDAAIEKARAGLYHDRIEDEVSPERLRRFFIKEEEHRYRVTKTIRDLCVFARHDVTRDPPFSRLDLISCRNLLIYFDRNLQNHLVRMFHYSLKANGFLVLGPSETAGRTDLFRLSEGRRQIYRRQPASGGRAPASLAVEGRDRPTTPDTVRPRTRNRSRASDLKRKPSVCS